MTWLFSSDLQDILLVGLKAGVLPFPAVKRLPQDPNLPDEVPHW
jgi:hypothetical protein